MSSLICIFCFYVLPRKLIFKIGKRYPNLTIYGVQVIRSDQE